MVSGSNCAEERRDRFLRVVFVLAIVAFLVVGLGGCSTAGEWYQPRTPAVLVQASQPCPPTIGKARDVENVDPSDPKLVPSGENPDGGEVCIYGGPLRPSVAVRQIEFTAAQATRVAAALAKVDLSAPYGTVNCPNDTGSFAIIALSYPGARTVDEFWSTTGCPTLDNGRLGAWQLGSDSFNTFQKTFDIAADLPQGPGVP